jgi:hypothetical protein
MSNLPEIDPEQIEQKLLTRLAEQTKHMVRLEVLAEALRDERDSARRERDHYSSMVEELHGKDTTNEDSGGA